ncbi:MAG: hypothetical protein JWP12_1601 [Bacteroidetes bacterium]|nr:hypothetical protein [Bacteroidota bacterium]
MRKKQLRQIKTMAKKSAGPNRNWLTRYEREAFVKGYVKGALEWIC